MLILLMSLKWYLFGFFTAKFLFFPLGRYFETMQISYFFSYFHPLILASISGSRGQLLLLCYSNNHFYFLYSFYIHYLEFYKKELSFLPPPSIYLFNIYIIIVHLFCSMGYNPVLSWFCWSNYPSSGYWELFQNRSCSLLLCQDFLRSFLLFDSMWYSRMILYFPCHCRGINHFPSRPNSFY